MYDNDILKDQFFFALYITVTVLDVVACLYLLLRKGNAFANGNNSPVRLRRWTAVYFGSAAMSHLWYIPIFMLCTSETIRMGYLYGILLDCFTIIPSIIAVMLCMLQDRHRPLRPFLLALLPIIIGIAWIIIFNDRTMVVPLRIYFILISIAFLIYIIRAMLQYSRWLRDNFADPEYKEVSQNYMLITLSLLSTCLFVNIIGGSAYEYFVQVCGLLIVCFLPWRVETLLDLSLVQQQYALEAESVATETGGEAEDANTPLSNDNIAESLQLHCVDKQLYLQHDLTIHKLAKFVGVNRLYLSQYFSAKSMNYNVYINNLRIDYFIRRYRETIASGESFTIQQLAHESGYNSYSTFSLAFKKRTNQSVTAWTQEENMSHEPQGDE